MGRPERILHPGRSALDRFGYELRQLRKERGYSLARLAGMVYVSADLLQRIETAERRPSQELTEQLDKALQADGALLERWRDLSAESGGREVTAISPDQGRRVIQALDVIGNDHLGDVADSLAGLVDHYAVTICALPPQMFTMSFSQLGHTRAGSLNAPGLRHGAQILLSRQAGYLICSPLRRATWGSMQLPGFGVPMLSAVAKTRGARS